MFAMGSPLSALAEAQKPEGSSASGAVASVTALRQIDYLPPLMLVDQRGKQISLSSVKANRSWLVSSTRHARASVK